MTLPVFIVNAFTQSTFGGNPAAVCPLTHWLEDSVMQAMAAQHNLSETAFLVPSVNAGVDFDIRWFTPTTEVDLCGHATLASAFVIFNKLADDVLGEWPDTVNSMVLSCRAGRLVLTRAPDQKITLRLSSVPVVQYTPEAELLSALGVSPRSCWLRETINRDVICQLKSINDVANITPDLSLLKTLNYRLIMVSALQAWQDQDLPSFDYRVFAPKVGVGEDPVTGSACGMLVPFWSQQSNGATTFIARQRSARGGVLWCELNRDTVDVSGYCVLYVSGRIHAVN